MERPLPTSSKSLSRGRPFLSQYLALRASWFRREKLSFWELPDTLRYLTAFLLVSSATSCCCLLLLQKFPTGVVLVNLDDEFLHVQGWGVRRLLIVGDIGVGHDEVEGPLDVHG